MKKDHYRDYAVDAYRYYAVCGQPDAAELRSARSTLSWEQRSALSDLEAVCRVLDRLYTEPDGQRYRRCLELVYFSQPHRALSRGVITERVSRAASELCIGQTTVYRMLHRLRLMLAIERGLRTEDNALRMTRASSPPPQHIPPAMLHPSAIHPPVFR